MGTFFRPISDTWAISCQQCEILEILLRPRVPVSVLRGPASVADNVTWFHLSDPVVCSFEDVLYSIVLSVSCTPSVGFNSHGSVIGRLQGG